MASVKRGWEPPGQSISGPSMAKRWVIPIETWKEVWDLFHNYTDQTKADYWIGNLIWEAVRLPPSLTLRLLHRLERQSHADYPGGAKPTRLEAELSSNNLYVPVYQAVHAVNQLEDPSRNYRGQDPDLDPGPVVGEVLFAAIRMQGYSADQIFKMDKTLRLAKILESHVRDDRLVTILGREVPSGHESP